MIHKSPLRVSLTGGAVDIPDYIGYHTGSSIVASIDKYMTVEVTTGKTNLPPGIYPPCDLIDSLIKKLPFGDLLSDIQIRWESDIPLGNGLGGSAALLVALAKHFFTSENYQAYMAGLIEIANGSGWQDAAICAWEGCRIFKYRYNRFFLAESLSLPCSDYFMLIDSGKAHDTEKQREDRSKVDTAFITNANQCVELCRKALLVGDYQLIGEVMLEIHQLKCKNPLYINDEMNQFLHECFKHGAYGGKLSGSGGGGHFFLVVDPLKKDRLRNIVAAYEYKEVHFNFV